ncbi:MAG: hypothetical protein ACFFBD_24800, partial [Candidatus Hodarchaeota archaeon]
MNWKSINKMFILIGLSLTILGLALHSYQPTELSVKKLGLGPWEIYDKHVKLESTLHNTDFQMSFRLLIYHTSEDDCLVLILNQTEYFEFKQNIQFIRNLTSNIDLKHKNDSSSTILEFEKIFTFKNREKVEFHLIIFNKIGDLMFGAFSLIIIPPNYYPGLQLIYIGVGITFLGLFFFFTGWKKYLVMGIGVNLGIFLLRIPVLGQFVDLGVQYPNLSHLISPEMYTDFEYYYMAWMDPLMKSGLSSIYSGSLLGHHFPPLFILTLGFFNLIPLVPAWKIAIPLFIYHLATGMLVFLLSFRISQEEKVASRAMLFYYLNPISLIYASFCWLNPPAFIFFVILAFYLAFQQKYEVNVFGTRITSYDLAMFVLALGTMYKQFAAIFVPLLVFTIIKNQETKTLKVKLIKLIRNFCIYGLTIFLIALPFLIIDFDGFMQFAVFSPTVLDLDHTKIISYGYSVNFNTLFVFLGAPDFITDIIGYLTIFWIFLGASTILVYLFYWLETKKFIKTLKSRNFATFLTKNSIFWSLILVFCIQLFYPRGTWKFYLLLLVPFLSLTLSFMEGAIVSNQRKFPLNIPREYPISYALLLIIFLISKYIYFAILIAWMVYFLIKRK